MHPDTLNATYETITNPILRLLIWMLAGAVVALCGAVVYLYRERQVLQRQMIEANFDAITALNNVADAIEAVRDEIALLKSSLP